MCGPKGASSYWHRLQWLNVPLMAYMFIQLNSIAVCSSHVLLQLAVILIVVMLHYLVLLSTQSRRSKRYLTRPLCSSDFYRTRLG